MNREEKNNRQTLIIVALLCAALFGLAVAYSSLTAALNISFNSVTQNALTWSVGFEPGTITGVKSGSSNVVCGEATATFSTVSVADTTMTTLHDKCVYKLKVKNTGSVDAILASITTRTPNSVACNTDTTSKMICSNITYTLTTDQEGLALLGENNVLVAGTGTLDVYLTAEYTGTETGSASSQANGGFTLNYTQR